MAQTSLYHIYSHATSRILYLKVRSGLTFMRKHSFDLIALLDLSSWSSVEHILKQFRSLSEVSSLSRANFHFSKSTPSSGSIKFLGVTFLSSSSVAAAVPTYTCIYTLHIILHDRQLVCIVYMRRTHLNITLLSCTLTSLS